MQSAMQTIMISGDESFMAKLKLFIKQNANSSVSVTQKDGDAIKAELQESIKAYKEGRLKTYTFDEMKEICSKW